ncbi:hypothetical protein K1719_020775 [Acacia pycnantha]|nr:hypothetical protein K1719_020775 [Acacia pycnantha]
MMNKVKVWINFDDPDIGSKPLMTPNADQGENDPSLLSLNDPSYGIKIRDSTHTIVTASVSSSNNSHNIQIVAKPMQFETLVSSM